MKLKKDLELPSNKKFGYFFSFIFLMASIYIFFREFNILFYILCTCSIVFLLIAYFKSEILRPLNKLWMNFGLFLGMIVSPIVMGIIFFVIFSPIGILMRLFGRDELLIKLKRKHSYWINRNDDIQSNSFMKQF